MIRYPDTTTTTFILDKYKSRSIMSFNMANLSALMENTTAANQLRKCVVDMFFCCYSFT